MSADSHRRTVLLLPVILVSILPARCFRAIPFLIGAALVWIVAISMTVPLVIGKAWDNGSSGSHLGSDVAQASAWLFSADFGRSGPLETFLVYD